jgi:uncharacterized protein
LLKFNFARIARYPAPLRLVIFIFVLLLLWLPVAAPINWWVDDKNLVNILTLPLLYGAFIFLLRLWGKYVYRQPHLLQEYGLVKTRQNGRELLVGLGIGVVSVLGLFLVEGWLGWLWWRQYQISLGQVLWWRLVVEGLIVALAYGFAEELLFRGWLLDELQRDYRPHVVLWADAFIFATLHFIKPPSEAIATLPQFPALVLLGLTLVWARCGSGRLGLPIGLHAGLVWGYYVINVGQMVQYNDRISQWLTGINRNPLAGGMGLLFLGALSLGVRNFSRKSR